MACNTFNAKPTPAGCEPAAGCSFDAAPFCEETTAAQKHQPVAVAFSPRKPCNTAAATGRATPSSPRAPPGPQGVAPRSGTPLRPAPESGDQACSTQRWPVIMTKEQRRHALCMQITEAARYQRGFYSDGRPKDKLQIAKKNSVTKSNIPVRTLPALRVKKVNTATHLTNSNSYMMLSDAALEALLRDVNLLLGSQVEKDYTPDVLNQVWGLKLYQPSVYPMFPQQLKPTPPVTSGQRRPSL